MGLDMYAFRANRETMELEELAYWRKHNALHNFMQKIWEDMDYEEFMQGMPKLENPEDAFNQEDFNAMKEEQFNCIKVPLNSDRIDQLENAINNGELVPTSGFFFGSTDYDPAVYRDEDLAFIRNAREVIEEGDVVLYDSWW